MANPAEIASLIGAGWFAKKALGPSADALGESVRVFLASNVSRIFAKADEIARTRKDAIGPIKPALLTRMVIDASMSEDDETLTEWWANLFVEASIAGTNQHAVFSDMMALLGPSEVRCLHEFVHHCGQGEREDLSGKNYSRAPDLETQFEVIVQGATAVDDLPNNHASVVNDFARARLPWPIRITSWRLPTKTGGEESELALGSDMWASERDVELGILERAGIVKPLYSTSSVWGGNIWVRGVGLTPLGFEFFKACNGETLRE